MKFEEELSHAWPFALVEELSLRHHDMSDGSHWTLDGALGWPLGSIGSKSRFLFGLSATDLGIILNSIEYKCTYACFPTQ